MTTYYSNDIVTDKPKLTPLKAIKKFIIVYDIELKENPPIFYAWDEKRQPEWIESEVGLIPKESYFTVDYDKTKREWYIGYIVDYHNRKFVTIDDLTGRCDIST